MRIFTAVGALRRLCWRKVCVPLVFLAVALTCGDQDECLWSDTPRYCSKCVSMYHVGRLHWRVISGDSEQLAFLRMETHHPLLFPFLKGIKVRLEFVCTCLRSYLFVDETVVCYTGR